MAYKDLHGITEIKGGRYNNLSISYERDEEESDPYPMFLFIPDKEKSEHYHIELNKRQLSDLGRWINEFLKNNN